MTGYRSGFVAAPPEIVAALKSYRPTVGTAPQEFVQRASVAAWNDERHVEETRARYRAKRDVLIPAIEARGWEIVASQATMYLWIALPDGIPSRAFADRLMEEEGVIVLPGAGFGAGGEGFFRVSFIVPPARMGEAAERAGRVLAAMQAESGVEAVAAR